MILWWILVGLIAGALAKAVVPGSKSEPSGCLMTMALGVGGSILAGFLLKDVLHMPTSGSFPGTIIGATLGAILILAIGRKLWK